MAWKECSVPGRGADSELKESISEQGSGKEYAEILGRLGMAEDTSAAIDRVILAPPRMDDYFQLKYLL